MLLLIILPPATMELATLFAAEHVGVRPYRSSRPSAPAR